MVCEMQRWMHLSKLHVQRKSMNSFLNTLRAYPRYINYTLHYFYKHYGASRTIKGVVFFHYARVCAGLKHLLMCSTTDHVLDVNGCKIAFIHNDEGISNELLVFKNHEPISTELLKKELRNGFVCLDIGANIGYYALLERKIVGSEGKIIAVEPSPLNFACLKKNMHLNGFDDVLSFQFAFSIADGEISFLIDQQSNLSRVLNNGAERVRTRISCRMPTGGWVIKVPTRSLDSFVAQNPLEKLDFLRMDVEGHEVQIYKGGRSAIKRFKPILFLEIHNALIGLKGTIDFLEILRNDGYNIKYYVPRELNMPLIGGMKDIRKIDISHLIDRLNEGRVPECFHLFLVNT
jgi:FkbM family methyltransferase